MSLDLAEYSINSKDMVEHIIKQDELHIELLLVEDPESCFRVLSQLLAINRDGRTETFRVSRVENGRITDRAI